MRGRGESERGCSRNVLDRQVHRAETEMGDELAQVLSSDRAVVLVVSCCRISEPAKVDGEDLMANSKQGDQRTERPPALRKPCTSSIGERTAPTDTW